MGVAWFLVTGYKFSMLERVGDPIYDNAKPLTYPPLALIEAFVYGK